MSVLDEREKKVCLLKRAAGCAKDATRFVILDSNGARFNPVSLDFLIFLAVPSSQVISRRTSIYVTRNERTEIKKKKSVSLG